MAHRGADDFAEIVGAVAVQFECPLYGFVQRGCGVLDEAEAGADARREVRFVGIHDRVGKAAGGAHHGGRAVLQRIELVQPAGFVPAGHQEQVAAGFDEVGELFVEPQVQADFVRVAVFELLQFVVVLGVTFAEKHQLTAHVQEPRCRTHHQINPLLAHEAGDHAQNRCVRFDG